MAIKKLIPPKIRIDDGEKRKIKYRFKDKIATADTVAELKRCLNILSRHVFNESDGE